MKTVGIHEAKTHLSRLVDEAARGEALVTGMHALAVTESTVEHRDPFDRILLAQAAVEGFVLGTADKALIGLTQVMDLR